MTNETLSKMPVSLGVALLIATGCASHSPRAEPPGTTTRMVLNAQIASAFDKGQDAVGPATDGARAIRVLNAFREGAVVQPADVATTDDKGQASRRGSQ